MFREICSQCANCGNQGTICGGQAGIYFAEACPHSDQYIGSGRWE